jgi:tellurite resistance protein
MAGFIDELLTSYRTQLERHRNRPMLRGAMAACALAAVADGAVTFSERMRVDQILETLDRLSVFDPHEGVALFNEYAEGILSAPKEGRERALDAVQAVTGEPETAGLLIRICLAIAEAKPQKTLVEQIEIVMLCSLLGVEPNDAGLYTDGGAPARDLGLEG